MLGYYDGYHNGPAKPLTRKEWATLDCIECGVPQTHHKEDGAQWRCVMCSTFTNGEVIKE